MASHGTPDTLACLGMAPYNFEDAAVQGISAMSSASGYRIAGTNSVTLPFAYRVKRTRRRKTWQA
jgi:hypothetical protein